MDWIKCIQRAIDYTEAHLTEEIDYDAVAGEACSSSFHFQRVFGIMCGYTLGDYIRMRRLSLAAEELRGGAKVIDVALKYGYETPESFSRAFSRFHGITPKEAKNGGTVKSFSRLSVKLILTGGNEMEYRIEKPGAISVICKRTAVRKPETGAGTPEITGFWAECGRDGTMGKIISHIPEKPRLKGLLGICFSLETQGNTFPYGIGAEYDGAPVEEGLEVIDLPEYTYAVFPFRGKMPDAFIGTYRKIVSEFFPGTDRYEYAGGAEFEVYPSDDTADPDYYGEIWIAVNEK
ncbi:MAG: AraC family transcriptional regulator [Clostridia bacterium]|nr:AraC family transcriptional regulator [Clostridia bacterium]